MIEYLSYGTKCILTYPSLRGVSDLNTEDLAVQLYFDQKMVSRNTEQRVVVKLNSERGPKPVR